MELIKWANGKGYTLKANDPVEIELLLKALNSIDYYACEVEVDESKVGEA